MNRQNLLASIANTIRDYRQGEISPITPDHVDKWVCQFDKEEQLIILYEMSHLLSKYYLTKDKTKQFLSAILNYEKIFGDDPSSTLTKSQFLNIQRKGSSQKDLLNLLESINPNINVCQININHNINNAINYIYLDDCLLSGNTVFRDMEKFLNINSISNTNIHLIFLGFYSQGYNYYINQKLIRLTREKNISVKLWYLFKFENNDRNISEYDCLWSKEVTNDNYVNQFANLVSNNAQQKGWNPRLFRPDHIPSKETLFSSPQNRDIVEKAFLKKGAYICSLPQNRHKSMRPMGYEYLESLGFGSIFITYRNIANNCPLVLWWGDPSYSSSHPFSKWYPLFPRKVNEQSSIIGF